MQRGPVEEETGCNGLIAARASFGYEHDIQLRAALCVLAHPTCQNTIHHRVHRIAQRDAQQQDAEVEQDLVRVLARLLPTLLSQHLPHGIFRVELGAIWLTNDAAGRALREVDRLGGLRC